MQIAKLLGLLGLLAFGSHAAPIDNKHMTADLVRNIEREAVR